MKSLSPLPPLCRAPRAALGGAARFSVRFAELGTRPAPPWRAFGSGTIFFQHDLGDRPVLDGVPERIAVVTGSPVPEPLPARRIPRSIRQAALAVLRALAVIGIALFESGAQAARDSNTAVISAVITDTS